MIEVEAEHPVVRGQGGAEHLETHAFLGPFGQSPADGAIGASGSGDAFVTAAVHQSSEHVFEHDPVRHPSAVASPRVRRVELRSGIDVELRGELDPEGFDETDWQQGHGRSG